MMRAAILAASAAVAILAYAAGRDAEPAAKDAGDAAARRLVRPPMLSDPYQQAETARSRMEILPAALWAEPPQAEAGENMTAPIGASPFDPAPPPAEPAAAPAAAAPKPDQGPGADEIARSLSQDITAIVRSNGRSRLLLLDRTTFQRRTVSVGEIYRAGWKIARIEPDRIVLTRGKAPPLSVPIAFSLRAAPGQMPVGPFLASPSLSSDRQAAQVQTESRPRRRVTRPGNASR